MLVNMCMYLPMCRCYLLDEVDVGLHLPQVSIPPVVLEANHQCVGLQPAQSHSLRSTQTHVMNWTFLFYESLL